MTSTSLTKKISFIFVYGGALDPSSNNILSDLPKYNDISASFVHCNDLSGDDTLKDTNLTDKIVVVLPGAFFKSVGQTFTASGSSASGILILGGDERYNHSDYNTSPEFKDWLQNVDKRTFNSGVNSFLNGNTVTAKGRFVKPDAESDLLDLPACIQNTLDNGKLVKNTDPTFGLSLRYKHDASATKKRIMIRDTSFTELGSSKDNLEIPAITLVGLEDNNVDLSGIRIVKAKSHGVRVVECGDMDVNELTIKSSTNSFVDLTNSNPKFNDLLIDTNTNTNSDMEKSDPIIKGDSLSDPKFNVKETLSRGQRTPLKTDNNGLYIESANDGPYDRTHIFDLSAVTVMPTLCVLPTKTFKIKSGNTMELPSSLVVSGTLDASGVTFKPSSKTHDNAKSPPCIILAGKATGNNDTTFSNINHDDINGIKYNSDNINSSLTNCTLEDLGDASGVPALTCLKLNQPAGAAKINSVTVKNSKDIGVNMLHGSMNVDVLNIIDATKQFFVFDNYSGKVTKLNLNKTKKHDLALIEKKNTGADPEFLPLQNSKETVYLSGLYDYEATDAVSKKMFDNSLSKIPDIHVGGVEQFLCIKKDLDLPSDLYVNDKFQLNIVGEPNNELDLCGNRVHCVGNTDPDGNKLIINNGKKLVLNHCRFIKGGGLRLDNLSAAKNNIRNVFFEDCSSNIPALDISSGNVNITNLSMKENNGKCLKINKDFSGNIVNAYFKYGTNMDTLIDAEHVVDASNVTIKLDSKELHDSGNDDFPTMIPVADNSRGIMINGSFSGNDLFKLHNDLQTPALCVADGDDFTVDKNMSLPSTLIVGSNGRLEMEGAANASVSSWVVNATTGHKELGAAQGGDPNADPNSPNLNAYPNPNFKQKTPPDGTSPHGDHTINGLYAGNANPTLSVKTYVWECERSFNYQGGVATNAMSFHAGKYYIGWKGGNNWYVQEVTQNVSSVSGSITIKPQSNKTGKNTACPPGIVSLGDVSLTQAKLQTFNKLKPTILNKLYYNEFNNSTTKVTLKNCVLENLGDASLSSLNLIHSRKNNVLENIHFTYTGNEVVCKNALSIYGGDVDLKNIKIKGIDNVRNKESLVHTDDGHSGKITNLYLVPESTNVYDRALLECKADSSFNKTTTRFVVDSSGATDASGALADHKDGIFMSGHYVVGQHDTLAQDYYVFKFDASTSSIKTPVICVPYDTSMTLTDSMTLPSTLVATSSGIKNPICSVVPQKSKKGATSFEAPPAIVLLNKGHDASYNGFKSAQLTGLKYGSVRTAGLEMKNLTLKELGDASGCVSALTLINVKGAVTSNLYDNIVIKKSRYIDLTLEDCHNIDFSGCLMQKCPTYSNEPLPTDNNHEFIKVTDSSFCQFKDLTLDLNAGGLNKSLIVTDSNTNIRFVNKLQYHTSSGTTDVGIFANDTQNTEHLNIDYMFFLVGKYNGKGLAEKRMLDFGKNNTHIQTPKIFAGSKSTSNDITKTGDYKILDISGINLALPSALICSNNKKAQYEDKNGLVLTNSTLSVQADHCGVCRPGNKPRVIASHTQSDNGRFHISNCKLEGLGEEGSEPMPNSSGILGETSNSKSTYKHSGYPSLDILNCNKNSDDQDLSGIEINNSKDCDALFITGQRKITNLTIKDASLNYFVGHDYSITSAGSSLVENAHFVMTKTKDNHLIKLHIGDSILHGSGGYLPDGEVQNIFKKSSTGASLVRGVYFEGRYEDLSANKKALIEFSCTQLADSNRIYPDIYVKDKTKLVVKDIEMPLRSKLIVEPGASFVASNSSFVPDASANDSHNEMGAKIIGSGDGSGDTNNKTNIFLNNVIFDRLGKTDTNPSESVPPLEFEKLKDNDNVEIEKMTINKSKHTGLVINNSEISLNDVLIYKPADGKNSLALSNSNASIEYMTMVMSENSTDEFIKNENGTSSNLKNTSFYRLINKEPILIGYDASGVDASGTTISNSKATLDKPHTISVDNNITINGVTVSNSTNIEDINKGESKNNGRNFYSGGGAYLDITSQNYSDTFRDSVTKQE